MHRQIFFCKSWFRAKKRPTEIWSMEQAKLAHEAGQTYTVLVDSPERPFCFLEVTKGFVGVCFLDKQLRENLNYQFKEVEPGKLFLAMATYREFDGDDERVVSGTSYIFGNNGDVNIKRETFLPEHCLETSISRAEVSSNYAEFPAFGEYDSLIQIERSQSV